MIWWLHKRGGLMNINGVKIYNEGVSIDHDSEAKINEITRMFKSISPTANVNMRFLKNGKTYEGLLWGWAEATPIGAYNRGKSMHLVLDALSKKVKRDALKLLKQKHISRALSMAMAG